MDDVRPEQKPPAAGPLVLVLEGAGYRVLGPFARTIEALVGLADSAPDLAVIDHGAGDSDRSAFVVALTEAKVPLLVHSGIHCLDPTAFEGVPWLVEPAPSARVLEELAQLNSGIGSGL